MVRTVLLHARILAARGWSRAAFFAVLGLVMVWPLLEHAASYNEFRDAQVLFAYERNAVAAVKDYAQLPLWDPYYCGGLYALGTPQSRFASPTFLLSLVLGAQRAIPVIAYLMFLIGMEGAFRYAHERTHTALGPALAAPLFAFNGLFATAYFNGWINFFGFQLVPWVLWGVQLAGRRRVVGIALVALGFAFMVGFGGTYSTPLTAVFAVFEAVRTIAPLVRKWHLAWRGAVFLLLAAGLASAASMFRLWPIFETLRAAPRIMAGTPAHSWQGLSSAVFSPAGVESGNLALRGTLYFGFWALLLAPLGLLRHRFWPALILFALSVWTAFGYATLVSPFAWLRSLPAFETLRYPERFLFFAAFYAVELIAAGLGVLTRVTRRRAWFWPIWLLVGAALAAGYGGAIASAHGAWAQMWLSPPPAEVKQDFRQARGNRWLAGYYAPMQRGSISCWEAYPVPQSTELSGALEQEEFFPDPVAGTVERRRWSPDRIDLRVEALRPARLVVNQNWHPGWRASRGHVVSDQGRIAVDLPSGEYDLTLRFRPRSAIGGAVVSLAALGALCGLWWLRRRQGRLLARHNVPHVLWLSVAPWVALVLSWWWIEQPPAAPVVARNANGSPVVIDRLPEGSQPLSVDFEAPIRLSGALVPPGVDESRNAHFELYWQVNGSVPRTVGVFVHLEGPRGRVIKLDHHVVAATAFFADLPQGPVLRDAFSVHLGRRQEGLWRVYVGLWHVSGDGTRLAITAPGTARVSDDRVLVGTLEVKQ
jgi:hypothetical protein